MEEAKQVMRNDLRTGMGIGSVKSAMICSNSVDPTQATVAKMEQVSNDHVEGYTILQLDQMRRIQPTGGTPYLAPLTTGDSTNNQIEDVHPREDPLDVIMTEVNIRDTISTPVEDSMTEIMNTSTEDAMLGDISDSGEQNGFTSIETVKKQETVEPIGNSKVHEKVTSESQESSGAHLTNGQGTVRKPSLVPQFCEILGVSSHNAQLQITGASVGQSLNAIERGETLHAYLNKSSSMRDDVEPPSGSEQDEHAAAVPGRNELQHAVQTQPEDNVVQDRVDAMQNPIFRGDVKKPIKNSILNHSVVREPVPISANDLLIPSVGDKTQRSANSFTGEATDTIVRGESAGDEDHGNPGSNEISKRGKLIIPSHENSEVCLTIEASKMDVNAKTEEKTSQNVRSGSGRLIAFTRRKRKHLCSHRPDS